MAGVDHLPDVEGGTPLTDAAESAFELHGKRWVTAEFARAQERRIAELTESLRQQESQLRTALDELRQISQPPAESPLDLARRFHEAYERLAPSFGYETRTETRVFNPNSTNGRLMVAVCAELGAAVTTDGTPR